MSGTRPATRPSLHCGVVADTIGFESQRPTPRRMDDSTMTIH